MVSAPVAKNSRQGGINLDAVQSDPSLQTIVKTRIIARQQQVVRIDREKPQPLSAELQMLCIKTVEPGIKLNPATVTIPAKVL
jgi:bifunctional ADP-heptose synthase (sugar kinase/adenylyltransferase)